jgi:hypothetical protein
MNNFHAHTRYTVIKSRLQLGGGMWISNSWNLLVLLAHILMVAYPHVNDSEMQELNRIYYAVLIMRSVADHKRMIEVRLGSATCHGVHKDSRPQQRLVGPSDVQVANINIHA